MIEVTEKTLLPTLLSIERIRTDGGTQSRSELNTDKIAEYAQLMLGGTIFPPEIVFYDGSDYWLGDGFHRYHAKKYIGRETTYVEIKQGTRRDAVLHSMEANTRHGIPLPLFDRKRCAKALLEDSEWSQWSDREIGRRCGLSHVTIGAMRQELTGKNDHLRINQPVELDEEDFDVRLGRTNEDKRREVIKFFETTPDTDLSNREIARKCGVSEHLVRDIRKELLEEQERTEQELAKAEAIKEAEQKLEQELEPEPESPKEPEPIQVEIEDTVEEIEMEEVEDVEQEQEPVSEPEQTAEEQEPETTQDVEPDIASLEETEVETEDVPVVEPEQDTPQSDITEEDESFEEIEDTYQYRYDPETHEAYCKYCYNTHRLWEIFDDVFPGDHVWECQVCEHRTKDEFMQIESKVVAVPVEEEEEDESKEQRDAHVMRVMGSSDSPEWYTPQMVIDLVIKMFEIIDTDPCSNSHESPTVPARNLYTKDDDGLAYTWTGKTYLNPPYGSEIGKWTNKLIDDYEQGNVEEALALLPARIDTAWFQPLYSYLMCNVRGRIQFANSPYSAPFPCVIVYLGKREDRFVEVFRDLGPIMRRIG